MTAILIGIALVCVIWSIVAGILSVRYCERHGVSVNPALLNLEVLRCLHKYRAISRKEHGHVGPLFYHYVIPINAALLLAIVLIARTVLSH